MAGNTCAPEPWLETFRGGACSAGTRGLVRAVRRGSAIWRDLVAFTWNIVTLEGRDAIAAMVREQARADRRDRISRPTIPRCR